MVNLVRVDGWPVAPATAGAFARLKQAFDACRFRDDDGNLVTLHVFSGFRSYAEQEKIFRERYVLWGDVNGRTVYDTRWWLGLLWYRIDAAGTVAQPGTSNHGDGRALDIYDSGSDAGVTRYGNERSAWIRDNAHRFGFEPDGYRNFNEPWHIKYTAGDPWAVFLADHPELTELDTDTAAPVADEQEDDMAGIVQFVKVPGKSGDRNGGIYGLIREGEKVRQGFIGSDADAYITNAGTLICKTQAAADRLERLVGVDFKG